MPYSLPNPPPASLSTTPAGSPPAYTRSLSTHAVSSYSFSNEKGPGTFASLGNVPRRGPGPSLIGNPKATSATAKRFHIRSSPEHSSSSSDDDEDAEEPAHLSLRRSNQTLSKKNDGDDDDERSSGIPPLRLRINRTGSPSFGVPFPRSSPLSSPLPGASSPLPSPTRTSSGLLSPLSGLNSPTSEITNLPASPGDRLPISASNPIYSPYKYSPRDGTAFPLPLRPVPTRSSSSPHIPHVRPLKSSLKSSSSTSSIHSHTHHARHLPAHSAHQRAASAPTTPAFDFASNSSSSSPSSSPSSSSSQLDAGANSPTTPKSVHFPLSPSHLERVHIFHKSAKPASLLAVRAQGEETETETETDRGSDWGYGFSRGSSGRDAYPFPKLPRSPLALNSSVWPPSPPVTEASEFRSGSTRLELDMTGYPVPKPSIHLPGTNILLESISLSSTAPEDKLHVHGAFIVRNLAYHKEVAVRFTFDDWVTVSEIKATWVANFPSPFPNHRSAATKDTDSWDRFTFSINLSDYTLASLPSKVIYFVGRYTIPGSEYWDNCGGRNWRIKFRAIKETEVTKSDKVASKETPSMMVSPPRVSPPATSTFTTVATSSLSTTPPASTPPVTPPSPARSEALAQATAQRLRRFSLSNYVAPTSSIPPPAVRPQAEVDVNLIYKSSIPAPSSPEIQSKESDSADKAQPLTAETSPRSQPSTAPARSLTEASPVTPSPSTSSLPAQAAPTSANPDLNWIIQQWCFASSTGVPDQSWKGTEQAYTIPSGNMGLEIGG